MRQSDGERFSLRKHREIQGPGHGGQMAHHLQGELQAVFDTLYEMGVIEPVLKMDWKSGLEEMNDGSPKLKRAIRIANSCGKNRMMMRAELEKLDQKSLEILAMEVAREYADYHLRESIH